MIASIRHFGPRKNNSEELFLRKIFGFTESSLIYHLHDTRQSDTRATCVIHVSSTLVDVENPTGSVLVITGFIFNKMCFVTAVVLQLVLLLMCWS